MHPCASPLRGYRENLFPTTIQGMFRDEGPDLVIMALHKKHNAEDVRLKARPMGRSPKARLCDIAFHHAMSMLSKQCLDPGFWASPEFMILNQSCP